MGEEVVVGGKICFGTPRRGKDRGRCWGQKSGEEAPPTADQRGARAFGGDAPLLSVGAVCRQTRRVEEDPGASRQEGGAAYERTPRQKTPFKTGLVVANTRA